jgi:hypothetical protein
MKKTLIALAAVAVSSAAMAQVTISGTFNVDVQNKMDARAQTVGMGDAQVKFSTSEDLGGGMKFSANTTLDTDAGRAGTVLGMGYSASLSSGFGTVTLVNGLAGSTELGAVASTASDLHNVAGGYKTRTRLKYSAPEIIKGVSLDLHTSKKGADASTAQGSFEPSFDNTMGFDLGYSTDKLFVGASGALNAFDEASWYLGYDFGMAKIDLAYGQYSGGHTEILVAVPMGPVTASLQTMKSDDVNAYGVRLAYALSKRTNISLNYTDASKSVDDAATGDNYRVRVSHSF